MYLPVFLVVVVFAAPCAAFPQVSVSPTNQTVPEGKASNISCKVTAGAPKPTLSWSFEDKRLPQDTFNVTEIENGSVIHVLNTTKSMEGTYKCMANNSAGASNATSTLRVLEKPTADIRQKPYPKILAGGDLELTCTVSDTTAEVKWKKNGSPVISRAHISQNGYKSTLVIKNVQSDDSGDYSCEARNQAGFMSSTVEVKVTELKGTAGTSLMWKYIVVPIAAVVFLELLIGCYICTRQMKAKAKVPSNPDEEQGIEMDVLNQDVDKWEIAPSRIILQDVIGAGSFGAVCKANLNAPDGRARRMPVAAKCFTPTAGEEGRKEFMCEIVLGKFLGDDATQNIVKFIGCVTTQTQPILVMEYMACGDLLGYLRKSRGIDDKYHVAEVAAVELQTYDLVVFAEQIAAGMVFLECRGISHRDLSARNVLLDENHVCKVTNFGLANQNFKYGHGNTKKGCMPVKWRAPEILYGDPADLSVRSDVWSYGVVLYEIFTIGGIPYPEWSESRTIAEIKSGYRMPKPEHIDDTLYYEMCRCWEESPVSRPYFEDLRQKMESYIENKIYLGMMDMARYNSAKYSKVEDTGADEKPQEQAAQAAKPTKAAGPAEPGRWGSWGS